MRGDFERCQNLSYRIQRIPIGEWMVFSHRILGADSLQESHLSPVVATLVATPGDRQATASHLKQGRE